MPRVIHFEIPADDPERAVQFYREVFGWTIDKWDGPSEYWLVGTGPESEPGIDGGLARRTEPGAGTENTIGVDSIDVYLQKITQNGGKILRPKAAVAGVGWLAYCEDTEGNRFGLMQDDPNAE
jgi:predicted enzyme related to lactoylglutathione lyase